MPRVRSITSYTFLCHLLCCRVTDVVCDVAGGDLHSSSLMSDMSSSVSEDSGPKWFFVGVEVHCGRFEWGLKVFDFLGLFCQVLLDADVCV